MWKQIPFEKEYEISYKGQVRNISTKYIKSLRVNKYGYLRVTLYPSGKTYNVHQLMAKVFLNHEDPNLVTNHIDGVKSNNILENLEVVTRKENCRHAYRLGLNTNKPKGNTVLVPSELVKRIRYGDLVGTDKYTLSDMFGFHYVTFRDIINCKTYKNI